MNIIQTLTVALLFETYLCEQNINKLFEKVNEKVSEFNAEAAGIAWNSSIDPNNEELQRRAAVYQKDRILWQDTICPELEVLDKRQWLNVTQKRQAYLLCRGPMFTFDEARSSSKLYERLQTIYSDAEVCIPTDKNIQKDNLRAVETAILNYLSNIKTFLNLEKESVLVAVKIAANSKIKKNAFCLKGEDDFEKMMAFSRNEEVLKWLWITWREKVGPPMRQPYRKLVDVENRASRRNGYSDIGASWRDELEISNLKQTCRKLYHKIKPLYTMLHGVIRYYLRRHYGDVVPERGPIPAHLLGNLWSQNWEPLADLIAPNIINLDSSIKKLNWTVSHMVKRADDFYQSLGLPAMTDTFWRESVFSRQNHHDTRCHGAAADMFKHGDYRLIYCSGTSKEDFYVLHHEMGHIQYYMAYENQPALFRQANTAFHEAVGDMIMYGVLAPQHLHRLGLINDTILYNSNENHQTTKKYLNLFNKYNNTTNQSSKTLQEKPDADLNLMNDEVTVNPELDLTTDEMLMLKQALNKLPQIPFSLLIDEYRWKYFEGSLEETTLNEEFWKMALELQGIAPTEERGEEYFDIGAKFHVPDNTPYIRYFLSSFLQHQLFESICKAAVFGRRNADEPLPDRITMNRCDIYGSKVAGKILKDFMSHGSSQHWRVILQATTGESDISASALERYYRPLFDVLKKIVHTHRIPIGW